MNFKDIETVKFELTETITWGVEKNIRNGFSIPVSTNDDEVKSKIENLAKKQNAKNPLYGHGDKKTLYLRSNCLAEEHKRDLLDKGLMYVKVQFETRCLFTNDDGVNHLCFKVTGLGKLNKTLPENDCPIVLT